MGCFVLGGQHASVQETAQGFPSARCARPMTELLPACPIAPLENEGTTSKSPEDKSISSHFFLVREDRSEMSQARAFLGAPPSGGSVAERLDAAPVLRTMVAENGRAQVLAAYV
jgi:hypothetical protein